MKMTLQDLLAPIPPERFMAEHYDRAPLHIEGGADKFAAVLDWAGINRLLDMTHVWTETSLKLVLDSVPVPPAQYSVKATSRDGAPVLQPVAARVQDWVRRGASVVMNDVDSLTPGLAAVSDALEGAGFGKAQANVYISWQSHKAFHAHYDTHDVWAVQVEGEKTWNVWEGRAEWPIAHPVFRGQPQDHHERAKGGLRAKVHLKKGDILYLPRGWYHDALAEAPNSVHVAYGVHAPLGMDLMNILTERALHDPAFRQPLPRQDGSPAAAYALTQRAALLGQKLQDFARDPKVLEVLAGFVRDYRFQRGGYDLLTARDGAPAAPAAPAPVPAAPPPGPAFRVVPGAKPVRRGNEFGLKTPAGVLVMTLPEVEASAWVMARPRVTEAELRAAWPTLDAPALIVRLREAGVLAA
ncbi:cupin domain-containing protein [Roseomonas sp. HF4]|uniref:cupin domain-containing protein n=1 Tax=Roseomonas sp. HF4 TaxID=2562313 RepID=UPI0010C156D1|nr:cupin domain-containing protein [Roseomonas sp. HF4]